MANPLEKDPNKTDDIKSPEEFKTRLSEFGRKLQGELNNEEAREILTGKEFEALTKYIREHQNEIDPHGDGYDETTGEYKGDKKSE